MNGTIYGLADYAIRCGLLQEDDGHGPSTGCWRSCG
jgi:hypothetical protein